MAGISVKDLTKIYANGYYGLKDVSLDINSGEFFVIVGPSGCGKTTILRTIAGLEMPNTGTIMIDGNIVNHVSPKDRDIAMVFQNFALYPHMTVFENMAFGLKVRGFSVSAINNKVWNIAKLLGIEHLLARKPSMLSGGQRQRVALGRAIVRNPKVFLFDEPLSNLDAQLRISMRAELKSLQRRFNTTTIYVTHDQIEAMTLGDKVCVLHNGIIQQVAAPLEIYEKPINRFVAGFFGILPMNFFNGVIRYKNDRVYFVIDGENISLPVRMRDKLTAYKDRNMILGIRPEHLSFEPNESQTENSIRCKAVMVEPLGDRMAVYLRNESENEIIAFVEHHVQIAESEPVTVYVDTKKLHIFEQAEVGKNVTN